MSWELIRTHTEHEVWQVDLVVSLGGVDVGEDLVIDEFDSKSIRDNHNYSLRRPALRRLGDICVQAMEFDNVAFWGSIVLGARKAVWARHSERRGWLAWNQCNSRSSESMASNRFQLISNNLELELLYISRI